MKNFFAECTPEYHIRTWKNALERGAFDDTFAHFAFCKKMGWSWEEMMACPERMYLSFQRIISLEKKKMMRVMEERRVKHV